MGSQRRPADFRRQVLSVGEVARRLRGFLEALPPLCVRGEVSGARISPSGHLYFTLSDDEARMECVAYKRAVRFVKEVVQDGCEIVASGTVSFYPPSGRLQMIVEQAEPSGEGRAKAALKELMNKLAGEGLFDVSRKIPLPRFPKRVAVVTSPNGAAVQDIVVSIRERFRPVDILVVPVPVQGADAPREITKALRIVDGEGLADVIIVGRGGGSEEDLAAFNDEGVVRAVAACKTPIVSAVGHEIDVTLTDLAADARAITPTAAGKMVVPDTRELLGLLGSRAEMMGMVVEQRLSEASTSVEVCAESLQRRSPRRKIDDFSQRVDMAAGRMDRALRHRLSLAVGRLSGVAERLRGRSPAASLRDRKTRMDYLGRALAQGVKTRLRVARLDLDREGATLNALSPLAVLGRGYTITTGPDGKPLRSFTAVNRGENIETKLKDGTIRSRVEETRERKEDGV